MPIIIETRTVKIQTITAAEILKHYPCLLAQEALVKYYPRGDIRLDDTFIHNLGETQHFSWGAWLARNFLPYDWRETYYNIVSYWVIKKYAETDKERARYCAAAFATLYNHYRS